jgi:nitroreductase
LAEQTASGACVCLSLVNAALAAGWGACWLTGWPLKDAGFRAEIGLGAGEEVLGFVHIGTETAEPPDRPRPDVAALTTWVSA